MDMAWGADDALSLCGRLDVRSAPDVRIALRNAVDSGGSEVVVELSGLEALDSTGLGVLLEAHRRAVHQGRRLRLHGVPPHMERLLRLTRLHRVFDWDRAARSAA